MIRSIFSSLDYLCVAGDGRFREQKRTGKLKYSTLKNLATKVHK